MKELVCIVCPNSCQLQARQTPDGGWEITKHTCKRGERFGIAEMTNPTRTLTTTVRTVCAALPVLPVRTDGEIPKSALHMAMTEINNIIVHPPLRRGEAVIKNLLNTGVDLIATADLIDE